MIGDLLKSVNERGSGNVQDTGYDSNDVTSVLI